MATGRRRPKFLLGIGCQKAGTTWLFDHLIGHPDVFLPMPKELHVFDAMLRPDMFREFHVRAQCEHEKRGWQSKLKEHFGTIRSFGERLSPADRLAMMADPQVYVRYFLDRASSFAVVGEITPSYAALSASDFEFIRDLLSPHFDLRVILLLRDPLQRAFSAIRHFRRTNKGTFDAALRGDDNALFKRLYNGPYVWERADYPAILRNVDAVFLPNEIHIEFFERLFTQDAVEGISNFLGIEAHAANFGKVVNPSPRPVELDPQLANVARAAYDPIYSYCSSRFGRAKLSEIWPSA